jgi:two-component system, cell cycle response regulator
MRILIADDDPVSLLLLESTLAEWGYQVTAARDGIEAWEALRGALAPPIAVIDWIMPGLDGIEVCRKVRHESEAPYVYLIMLTGKTEKSDIVQGMEAGADDYLSKPFDEQELQVRLRAGRRIVELQEALRAQATRDALTGVWNRGAILEILERELKRSVREGTSVGVVLADIDHFKRINDTLGHLAGDAALSEVATRMGAALRPYDALGRYGGEEFLIVLPGCDPAGTLAVAERVRTRISGTPVHSPGGVVAVTVSLGAATTEHWSNIDSLAVIRLADVALYRAKSEGRNRALLEVTAEELAEFREKLHSK